jgi:hypothetical protein
VTREINQLSLVANRAPLAEIDIDNENTHHIRIRGTSRSSLIHKSLVTFHPSGV